MPLYNKYRYILCVIDVFSRQAFATALRKRDIPTIKPLLDKLFQKRAPRVLTTDNEGAFVSLKDLYKRHGIKYVNADPGDHARMGIVERFNKTLRLRIQSAMTSYKTNNWVQFVEPCVEAYNFTPHSSIGNVKPADISSIAWIIPESNKVRKELATKRLMKKGFFFEPGDYVRIKLQKETFSKAADPNYSDEVYIVEKKIGDKYLVQGRRYRYNELQKVPQPTVQVVPAEQHRYKERAPTVYTGTRGHTKQQTRLQTGAITRRTW
jgi:hypothetical protein